ncbi:MAG: VWA domain-containing protein [Acidobacteria bacterium]|nr:VWA domain-containing protein [Acidobacteriota bacterium]MCA1608021.1 VWA domain-containing protein [Acidobacteriota bacterium]
MKFSNLSRIALASVIGMAGVGAFGDWSARAQQQSTPKAAVTPTPPPIDGDEEIKIETESVNVLFTAQDRNRRLLINLKREDIKVLENGREQQIATFTRQIDLPLSLAILIDTSASQERTLPEEKAAAASFLESVIRPSKDEVSIISFTGEATLEQGMTSNIQTLRRAIDRVRFVPPSGYIGGGVIAGTPPISHRNQAAAGSTAIWDAIWVTSAEILGEAPQRTRRAIILLSDGVNTFGQKKLDEAVQAAQRAEAVIYSIGIGDNFYDGVDEPTLKKISERTGGRAFFPRDEAELRAAFRLIQEEMRSQYLLAYEPSNQILDGSYRKIEIQLVNPELAKQKVKLTHREGYFAKTKK